MPECRSYGLGHGEPKLPSAARTKHSGVLWVSERVCGCDCVILTERWTTVTHGIYACVLTLWASGWMSLAVCASMYWLMGWSCNSFSVYCLCCCCFSSGRYILSVNSFFGALCLAHNNNDYAWSFPLTIFLSYDCDWRCILADLLREFFQINNVIL